MTTPNTAANGGQILTDERALFEVAYLAEFGNPANSGVANGVELAWLTGPGKMWQARASLAVPASEPVRLMNFGADGPAQWSGAHNACDLTKSVTTTYSNSVQIAVAPAPVSGMPDLARAMRKELNALDRELESTGYAEFGIMRTRVGTLIESLRLLVPDTPNPTGETK